MTTRLELPPVARSASVARAATTDFLASQGAGAISADDVVLAVSELVTNAVEAGAQQIHLELSYDDQVLTLVVEDDAPGWPAPRQAGEDAERGRGLGIVALVADHWDVRKSDHGKAVVAEFGDSRGA